MELSMSDTYGEYARLRVGGGRSTAVAPLMTNFGAVFMWYAISCHNRIEN